jgi:hypothetical protein
MVLVCVYMRTVPHPKRSAADHQRCPYQVTVQVAARLLHPHLPIRREVFEPALVTKLRDCSFC